MDDNVSWERSQELSMVMQHTLGESDRGITLIIAAHIEECLRRIIESFLIKSNDVGDLFDGPYAPFGTLSGKAKAAYVMGLITKSERDRIDAVRAVRNVFAHESSASFEHPRVLKICIKAVIDDGNQCARDAFLHMAQNTVLPLLYRDLDVTKSRRAELLLAV